MTSSWREFATREEQEQIEGLRTEALGPRCAIELLNAAQWSSRPRSTQTEVNADRTMGADSWVDVVSHNYVAK